MKVNWKKEAARDIIALGSVPFYFIVIIRTLVGPFWEFFNQLLIGGSVIFVLYYFMKDTNYYISRAIMLFVFTSLFYKDTLYTVFTLGVVVVFVLSLNYLKVKKEGIINGIVMGLLGSAAGYYLATLI